MKNELIDTEGNVIPPPDASTDVARLIYLLEYCRHRRFRLGPIVQVGDVIANVADPLLERSSGEPRRTENMSDDMKMLFDIEQGDE